MPRVCNVFRISSGNSGRVWAYSNNAGSLLQTDLLGNFLEKIKTWGGAEGYNAVTQDGDLLYADKKKKVIKRLTIDKNITTIIRTGDWAPVSIQYIHPTWGWGR